MKQQNSEHLYDLRVEDGGILCIFSSSEGKELDVSLKDFETFLETATEAEPLLILMDGRDAGKAPARARKAFAQLGQDPRVGKCALLGMGRYVRLMASFVNKAVGRDNIRFFGSEEKAIAWLKAGR